MLPTFRMQKSKKTFSKRFINIPIGTYTRCNNLFFDLLFSSRCFPSSFTRGNVSKYSNLENKIVKVKDTCRRSDSNLDLSTVNEPFSHWATTANCEIRREIKMSQVVYSAANTGRGQVLSTTELFHFNL